MKLTTHISWKSSDAQEKSYKLHVYSFYEFINSIDKEALIGLLLNNTFFVDDQETYISPIRRVLEHPENFD